MSWPRGFNAVLLFNMAEPCRRVLRLFSASLGSWKASKSFRLICQRNASQAQGCDAGKLRAMVVGLGNHSLPDTRHSVGMLVVDCLARHLGAVWHFNSRSIGHLAVTNVDDQEIILLKPTLAMNINGRSIARTAAMYNVNPSNVILVHDDLDKPVGKYSLKHGGSAGGHNGVRSAIASLSSDTPKRVRVGIGRPNKRDHVTEYVLSKFEPVEIPVVQGTVEKCCKVLIDELQLFKTQSNDTKETENSDAVRVQYLTQQQSVL